MTAGLARVGPVLPIDVLREQIAPDATDAELRHFAMVCARLDLSPFADQIVLIGRHDKRAGRVVHRHQVTVAGRRTLASRTGRPYRVHGPEWCAPRAEPDAPLQWSEVWTDDTEPPYCARVLIFFPEFAEYVANGTAKWAEFAQYDNAGKPLPLWRQMPSHMLGKVAESMALRRAFPDVIDPAVAEPYPVGPDTPELAELADAEAANARTLVPEAPAQTLTRPPVGRFSGEPPLPAAQAQAHRIIAALDADARDEWLAGWTIEDFGEVWPADAVADALGRA